MDNKNLTPVSESLTPVDVKNKEFSRAVYGYNPKEVVDFLDSTAKTWEKVQKHEKELLERIQHLQDDLLRWKGKEGDIEKLKEKAVQEAHAIKEEAMKEAAKHFAAVEERASAVRTKTEEWLENVIAQVTETERQKSNFMTAFKSALDSHYALLKTEQEEAEPLSSKLNHFLKTTLSEDARI